jgi:hypothetical protein
MHRFNFRYWGKADMAQSYRTSAYGPKPTCVACQYSQMTRDERLRGEIRMLYTRSSNTRGRSRSYTTFVASAVGMRTVMFRRISPHSIQPTGSTNPD